ncbi:MAG TPA: hypothetical protein VKM35_04795 [Arenimonas sp.]|uniref:hypothetical protein n=1 Tax=Arenimonas sp. TaxID=1872635 RepID=UPI002C13C867|nr:hypothetical protein [Arenimonas sp.]HMB56507.1 hypothetical protein [Arenimonas sp.]
MSAQTRQSHRDLRKRLLRLEAETHRLEMVANLRELRDPVSHLQRVPALLGLLGGSAGGFGAAAAFLSSSRFGWIVKAIPLALAGWRIARRVRELLAKRARHRDVAED